MKYAYFPLELLFDEARKSCERLGRGWTMAMPRTSSENQCVHNVKKLYAPSSLSTWLGFFRHGRGPYNATDGKPMGFTFWAANHPLRIAGRTCAMMWGRAPNPWQWGDQYCNPGQAYAGYRATVMCQKLAAGEEYASDCRLCEIMSLQVIAVH